MPRRRPVWADLADDQEGVVARRQLLALELSPSRARWPVEAERWRTVFPGVYVTHTGPLPALARIWAGLLYAGAGAHASHRTALFLAHVIDEPPEVVHVTVPASRRVRPQPGLAIHLSRWLPERSHPAASPPRTTLEDALLDSAELQSRTESVITLVFAATQRRLTTPLRVADALGRRRAHRWRGLITEILQDATDGIASPLEKRYATDVERAHGLPRGVRNAAEREKGRTRYRDVRYAGHGLVVELDGRGAHPDDQRFRDLRRDNEVVEARDVPLRYGWPDVAANPCAVAGQVAAVLRDRGWSGRPTPCGPGCSFM